MAPSKKNKPSQAAKTTSRKENKTIMDAALPIASSTSISKTLPVPLSPSEQALLKELQRRSTVSVAVQQTEKDNGTSSLSSNNVSATIT